MYFGKCSNIDELKKEYRQLCFLHHPDKGGNVATMQVINAEYKVKLQLLARQTSEPDNEYEIGKQYQDQIDKVINLNIDIEICGKWIWVSGNTYPVKDKLKEAGFWWASKKQKWYWRPEKLKRGTKQTMSMDWIHNRYGSVAINKEVGIAIDYYV